MSRVSTNPRAALVLALAGLLACGCSDPVDGGTDTAAAFPLDRLLADPLAEGCDRWRQTPPAVLGLEDPASGLRLMVRTDLGPFSEDAPIPIDRAIDLADGGLVLEQTTLDGWEVGCGSIEEVAPLPHPDSTVFWAETGTARIELEAELESPWFWNGTLMLEGVRVLDDSGAEVLAIESLAVPARFNSSPPA